MRRVWPRAIPFALFLLLAFPRAHALWRRVLRGALLPALSGFCARAAFPVAGIVFALCAGACLARGGKKRALRMLAALLWLLCALWFPLYAEKPYEICADATAEELYALCEDLAARARALESSEISKESALSLASEAMRSLYGSAAAPPKYARYPEWMRALNIAGIYIPLTGEAIVNPGEPAFSLPFVACHELAHQMGIANEGQANLCAYMACVSSGQGALAYAGYVEALRYAVAALAEIAPERAQDALMGLSPKVLRDAKAVGMGASGARTLFAGDYGDLAAGLACMARASTLPSNPKA